MIFNEMKSKNFFIDLFNSPALNKCVSEIMISSKIVSECKMRKLKSNFVDLGFLDILEEKRIVGKDG